MDGGRGQAAAICLPTTTTKNLRPVLAADADESVLLASKVKSKDDDVRTRILLLSQRAEELQDAVNLACRHTQCSVRDTKKPKSKRQWQEMFLGDAVMGSLVVHGADNTGLSIAPLDGLDAGRGTQG